MNTFILVQILGILSLVIFVIALQQRKKETFLLLQTGGALLYILQYILTNRITGAVTFTIIAIRGLVFYYYKKKELKPALAVLIAFLVILAASTYLTWQNIFSIVPFLAAVLKTWGTWQDSMKWTRRTSLLAQTCMVVYNLSATMYTSAITEVCNLISTVIAMWRFDRKNKKGLSKHEL